jgi:D-lactate dehydrogenase
MAMNRKIVLANNQMKMQDFSLSNLVGFDLFGKRVGVLGTGAVGSVVVRILHGFGCEIFANDLEPNLKLEKEYDVKYLPKHEMQQRCDVLVICLPLTSETHHLIDASVLSGMQDGTYIVNVARGAIVDTKAVLEALNSGKLQGYAADVYEKEGGVYFYDRRGDKLKDPIFKELVNHPKVLLSPHQAFATREALQKIAEITFYNLNCWRRQKTPDFEL